MDELRRQVIATYERVAREPNDRYHFHRGPEYAQDLLGYDREELAATSARARLSRPSRAPALRLLAASRPQVVTVARSGELGASTP